MTENWFRDVVCRDAQNDMKRDENFSRSAPFFSLRNLTCEESQNLSVSIQSHNVSSRWNRWAERIQTRSWDYIKKTKEKERRAFNKNWSLRREIQKLNSHECIDWSKHSFNIYEKTSQLAFSRTLDYEESSKSIAVLIELSLISSCS